MERDMVRDPDLLSVQEARVLVGSARRAWDSYSHFSQEQVDRIIAAAAEAASGVAEELARNAVDETGFGIVKHKFVKNKFAAIDVYRFIKDLKTVGIIREDPQRKLYEIAEPVGVVAARRPKKGTKTRGPPRTFWSITMATPRLSPSDRRMPRTAAEVRLAVS